MERARKIHRIALALLLCALLLIFAASRGERGDRLKIFFLDIGQGDSIYIRTPSGRDMLVDGGPSPAVVRRLSEVMPWYDRSIDVVIETHPDADHIGGLVDVLARYRVGVFLEPGVESENSIDDELARLRKEKGIDHVIARRGMRVDFGDGAHFDILFPDTDVTYFETNTASIVGLMKYGSTSVMLTGDSPKSVENRLVLLDGPRLRSDVLKAGHHGSHTSSGEYFVGAVSPRYAIVSAGKDNRYGHPHRDVSDLFLKLGIEMLRTDVLGTIGFVSDGSKFWRK
jgi:competence protein ComEC